MKIVSYCSGSGVLPLPVNGDGQPTPTPQGRDPYQSIPWGGDTG